MFEAVKEREVQATEQNQKKNNDVDELFEKKGKKEAELAKLEQELLQLKEENNEFPEQFRQMEDHQLRTEQELRRRELELQQKEQELAEIEKQKQQEESKRKRGTQKSQVKKQKKGIFNSSKGKRPGRETVTSTKDPSSLPNSATIDLNLVTEDPFDNQANDPRFSDSNQTYGSFATRSSKFGTDLMGVVQAENQVIPSHAQSLHFDRSLDEDVLQKPDFGRTQSLQTDHRSIRKNKKKKMKGTINPEGARNTNSGACCSGGQDQCTVF